MSGYIGSTPVPQATQHRESFTATAGQTSFATAGYTPQFVDVYLNGVHLSPADVTATNGSDVVLVACLVNDIVDVVSYSPFEVASTTFTGTTTMDVAAITGVLTTTAATVFNGGFGSSKASNVIAADGAAANAFAMQIHNLEATANQSFGLYIQAGSGSDQALKIADHDAANDLFTLTGAGVATIKNGLTLTDGNLVVAAGHGVDFSAQTATSVTGASATAELLDHYEEGTWTPTVAGLSLSSVSAHYTRIGDMVHFGFDLTMPSTSATTHMKVTGVPFSITTNEFGASLNFTTSAVINSLIIGVANSNDLQFYAPESAFATYANFSQKIVRASGSFKTDTA